MHAHAPVFSSLSARLTGQIILQAIASVYYQTDVLLPTPLIRPVSLIRIVFFTFSLPLFPVTSLLPVCLLTLFFCTVIDWWITHRTITLLPLN